MENKWTVQRKREETEMLLLERKWEKVESKKTIRESDSGEQ